MDAAEDVFRNFAAIEFSNESCLGCFRGYVAKALAVSTKLAAGAAGKAPISAA